MCTRDVCARACIANEDPDLRDLTFVQDVVHCITDGVHTLTLRAKYAGVYCLD